MRTVLYREMVREDWDAIFALACAIWYSDIDEIDDDEVRLLASTIDISLVLKRSSHGIVAIDEQTGSIVGVVCVTGTEPPPKRVQGWHEVAIAKALDRGARIGEARGDDTGVQLKGLDAELRRYLALTDELTRDGYDGEVTLLLLDAGYQGLGIGRELIDRGIEWLHAQGSRSLYLVTDDSCNYPFYDRLGWRQAHAFKADITIFGKVWETVEFIYESPPEEL